MKRPSTFNSEILFVFKFLILIALTSLGSVVPITSSTALSQIISIFLLAFNFS